MQVSDLKKISKKFTGDLKGKKDSSTQINTILARKNDLVVSKIVTLQEFIQSRKKFVVVEGINGFYITGAVI